MSTKSAQKQVFFAHFEGEDLSLRSRNKKQKCPARREEQNNKKIKKIHLAVFEIFEKEHKKQVFLHLNRCKKPKIQKSGSVRFCPFPRRIH